MSGIATRYENYVSAIGIHPDLLGGDEGIERLAALFTSWSNDVALIDVVAVLMGIRRDTDADRETMFALLARRTCIAYEAIYDTWLDAEWDGDNLVSPGASGTRPLNDYR